MDYSIERDGVDNCTCEEGFEWNSTANLCVIVCDMDYTVERDAIDNCTCEEGF